MNQENISKVPIACQAEKRSLTAVLTVSMAGDFLPMQLIFTGKTARSLPKHQFPDEFSVTQNPSHQSNKLTMLKYINEILKPYLEKQRKVHGDKPSLLIYNAQTQTIDNVLQKKLTELNMKLVMVPKNMTEYLQPLDIIVNKLVKRYMQAHFKEWYTGQIVQLVQSGEDNYEGIGNSIKSAVTLRELTAAWITAMYNHLNEPSRQDIIIDGFRHCGIVHRCENGPLAEDPE